MRAVALSKDDYAIANYLVRDIDRSAEKKMVRGEMRNDGNKRRVEILLGKYLAASSTIIPCLRRN